MQQFSQEHGSNPVQSELSRSPQINQLIRAVQSFSEDVAPADTVLKAIQDTQTFIEYLRNVFEGQRRFQPPGDTLDAETPRIREGLDKLTGWVAGMRSRVEANDRLALERTAADVRQVADRLFQSFDALKEADLRAEVLSRSPFMNRLRRVGNAVVAGKMDAEVFRDLLNHMLAYHAQLVAQVTGTRPQSANEARVLEERRPALEQALADHLRGLQEAQLYFSDGKVAHITGGLETANDATNRLFEIQESFVQAEQATRTRPCMRCGADNDVQARRCTRCQTALPPVLDTEEASVDVTLEDQIRQSGHVRTETTQRLMNDVQAVRDRQMTPEEFLQTIEWLEGLVARGKREYAGLQPPPHPTEAEQEAIAVANQLFASATADMEEGIRRFRVFLENGNTGDLEGGLESALQGGDQLHQIQVMTASRPAGYVD